MRFVLGSVVDLAAVLTELSLKYGYSGVFVASILGSVIPFLPVPYLIIVVLLSGSLDPVALGVAAGVGGAIGKSTSYLLGRSGYLISKPETQHNLAFLGRFLKKYGDLGVFVFAVTPLPDDIYMIPMGMVKFPFWRFMLANTAGKVILSTAVAFFGRAYFGFAGLLGEGQVWTVAVLILATVGMTVLLARADWEKAYRKYKAGGAGSVVLGLPEILKLTKPERREES
ncbi:MAG: VTT domain-containing protein [Thaumarchaeota archaeon]|nr:VTT domain-containing protein [Nitrososphaerota archaeon]